MEACLNHANQGDFRLVEGIRMAFVSGLAVKVIRLLPLNRHLCRMDIGTRAQWEISAYTSFSMESEILWPR